MGEAMLMGAMMQQKKKRKKRRRRKSRWTLEVAWICSEGMMKVETIKLAASDKYDTVPTFRFFFFRGRTTSLHNHLKTSLHNHLKTSLHSHLKTSLLSHFLVS